MGSSSGLLIAGVEHGGGPLARHRLALHRAQRGTGEHHERDEGRDGVPGQTEHERSVERPEPGGVAGLECEAPERLSRSELAQSRADVIVLSDRHAAADDDGVGVPEGVLDGGAGARLLVADPHTVHDDRSGRASEGGNRVGVGVPQSAGAHRLVGGEQLVAGHEHADAGRTSAADTRASERGEHAELRRAQRRAALEDGGAAGDVLAGAADLGSV